MLLGSLTPVNDGDEATTAWTCRDTYDPPSVVRLGRYIAAWPWFTTNPKLS
jgi:hypothetical protein